MENPVIGEAELKPIVEAVESRMGIFRRSYRARNLPEQGPGACRRIIGGIILLQLGLTCNACGHIMPITSKVPGYADLFRIPRSSFNGERRKNYKKHIFCLGCSSEIVMENWEIVSGATEYPPGAKPTGFFNLEEDSSVSVGALEAAADKLTINGCSGQ